MKGTWAIAFLALLAAGCSESELPGDLTSALGDSRGHRSRDDATTELFRLMGKNTIWTPVDTVAMQGWTTFHTEGMVAVGDRFFVSAVETLEAPVRNGVETDALYDFSIDRSPGRGRGWLFEFAADGTLLGQLELTEGDIYHPGGIDYDGESIWVPLAENRPNSRSQISIASIRTRSRPSWPSARTTTSAASCTTSSGGRFTG